MAQYQALHLFIRFGPRLALLTTAVIWGAAIWATAGSLIGWFALLVSVGAGLLAGFLLLVFVDLTRIIVEMLLPR